MFISLDSSAIYISKYSILSFRLSREHYLNTEEFIDAVADELKTRLSAN